MSTFREIAHFPCAWQRDWALLSSGWINRARTFLTELPMTLRPDPLAYPPRGMSRDEAARYIGVGATKFDEMSPMAACRGSSGIDGRVGWDRLRVEAAFSELPEDNKANPLDRIAGFGLAAMAFHQRQG
jgi:hypothetical protein